MPQHNIKQVKGSTQGSILFLGNNGVVSENNFQLFWSTTNNSLVIGTTSLFGSEKFRIIGDQRIDGNLVISGSFSVLGSASVINTQNLQVQDPIILLASTQSGAPALDSGIFINRGTGATQGFIWDESATEFSFIQTNDGASTIGNVNISSYAKIRAGGLTVSQINITSGASNNFVLISNATGLSSWTSSSVVLANANGVTGSGTANYVPRWISANNLSGTGSIYDSGTAVGIATQSNGAYALNVLGDVNILGTLYATSKSFEITHPLDSTKRLTYGSLEGPEYGVYYRGRLNNESVINLPDYWTVLIDESSITISLTPFGIYQNLFVEKVENNKVYIGSGNSGLASCYYVVYAERKDIPKIVIEK